MAAGIKEINAEVALGNLYKKATSAKIPFRTNFELTYNCNLKCCHCYNPRSKKQDELSYSEICSILDQLSEIGCFHLNLTGGEIFTRQDIFKILKYAKKKGFYLVLLTNGTLITPEVADFLQALNPNLVDISLYGMKEETYQSITQIPGSFHRCLQGIRLLKERNVPICLKLTVMTLNINDFSEVKAFAEKLEVPFRYGWLIYPRIDGSKEPLTFRLTPEQVIELEVKNRPFLFEEEKNRKERKLPSDKTSFFYCGASRNSLAITPYGELNLCLQYHFPQYDLRKGSVSEGWKELVDYVKSAKPGKNYQCGNCKLWEFCRRCPADGWLERGHRSVCLPYFKRLAKLRSERMKNG